MKHAALLLLAPVLTAQTSLVSPAGHDTGEGNGASLWPFFTTMRYLQIHTDLKGPARTIKGLSFRRDGVNNNQGQGVKRTLDLEVWLGEGDFNKRSPTFSSNYTSPPTTVFTRKKFNAPDWVAPPRQAPAPFDLNLVFDTPGVYGGKADLVWEMAVWNTDQPRQLYYADGTTSGSTGMGTSRRIGLGCVAANQTAPMFTSVLLTTHRVPDRVGYFASTKNAARNAPLVVLAGLSNPSVPIPTCGPATLYTDPLLAVPLTTDTTGTAATPSTLRFPWNPAFQGVKIYSQSYCPDNTQPFPWPVAVSNGAEATVPALGQPPDPFARVVAEAQPGATTGDVYLGWTVVTRFEL